MSASLKVRDMTDEQLVYFFELWARGRKNADEAKAELLRRLTKADPVAEPAPPAKAHKGE